MGNFSWLDCKTNKPIKNYRQKNVYVLVPKEFCDKFGKRITEGCYDGYGHFDTYDMYALVAFWNKEYLSEELLEKAPELRQFGGLWDFEKEKLKKEGKSDKEIDDLDRAEQKKYFDIAMNRRNNMIRLMNDYKDGMDDNTLKEKYGRDYLREIGIAISCYDEQNRALKFPIKITYDSKAVYEECKASDSDENQGF